MRFLGKRIQTKNFRQINVFINRSEKPESHWIGDGILTTYLNIDLENVVALSKDEQQELILDYAVEVLTSVFEHGKIETDLLAGAKSFVRNEGFKNWFSGPTSKNADMAAQVKILQSYDNSRLFIHVTKNGAMVQEFEFLKIPHTNPFAYRKYLEKLKWISDSTLKLSTLGQDYVFELSYANQVHRITQTRAR